MSGFAFIDMHIGSLEFLDAAEILCAEICSASLRDLLALQCSSAKQSEEVQRSEIRDQRSEIRDQRSEMRKYLQQKCNESLDEHPETLSSQSIPL